jgi:hypothetical protein
MAKIVSLNLNLFSFLVLNMERKVNLHFSTFVAKGDLILALKENMTPMMGKRKLADFLYRTN